MLPSDRFSVPAPSFRHHSKLLESSFLGKFNNCDTEDVDGNYFDSKESTSSESEPQKSCRVCYGEEGEDEGENWLHPCYCSGSMYWVHDVCLNMAISRSLQHGHGSFCCPICGYHYRYRRTLRPYAEWTKPQFELNIVDRLILLADVTSVLYLTLLWYHVRSGEISMNTWLRRAAVRVVEFVLWEKHLLYRRLMRRTLESITVCTISNR